ncbi:MAG: MFS transporter, partial [Microbacteriaceae bacterium]|nr:MFS transporter [Microbacteriaceae bacterium]
MTETAKLRKSPSFIWLWTGQTISVVGSQLSGLALPVFAVTMLGVSEAQLGLLGTFDNAAFLVFALLAGAWVDRWVKRRVMIVADLVRMLAVAAIPILYFAGLFQFWHLLVLGIPILFKDEQIGAANSALETSGQIAGIGGPSLVGWLLLFLKAPFLLLADAVSFLVSAITLSFIRDKEVPKPTEDRRPLREEIAEGLKFVWSQPLIRRISFTTATSNLFNSLAMVLFPIFILRYLDISVGVWGLMMSVASVGGLLGAMSASKLMKLIGEGQLIVYSAVASGLVFLVIPIVAFLPHELAPWILTVVEFCISFLVLTYNITQVSARQRLCPKPLLGRMNASIRFMVWGV